MFENGIYSYIACQHIDARLRYGNSVRPSNSGIVSRRLSSNCLLADIADPSFCFSEPNRRYEILTERPGALNADAIRKLCVSRTMSPLILETVQDKVMVTMDLYL